MSDEEHKQINIALISFVVALPFWFLGTSW